MNAGDVWATRVAQLRREAERVAHLLQADGAPSVDPAGQLCRRLEQLEARLAELAALPAGEPASWQQLEALEGECQAFFGSYLQLAGGLYLTNGPDGGALLDWLATFGEWLDGWREELHLELSLPLVAWSGDRFDYSGVVRVPFLDGDLWHLPLLAPALGLALFDEALAGRHPHSGEVQACLAEWQPRVARALESALEKPADSLGPQAASFLRHLAADMIAAALCGPLYPLALFVLVLDYGYPAALDSAEAAAGPPLVLPSAADRAAAVLAALGTLAPERQSVKEARARLEKLWQAAVTTGVAGAAAGSEPLLAQRRERFAPLHDALYEKVVVPLAGPALAGAAGRWEEAWTLYHRWAGTPWAQNRPEPAGGSRRQLLATLSGAAWLYRLDRPDRTADILEVAIARLGGETIQPYRISKRESDLRGMVQRIRLEDARARWQRLQALLRHRALPPADRRAVAGRFFRLLSERLHDWERRRATIASKPEEGWSELVTLQAGAKPLEEETLSFLGSVLIRQDGLDREPHSLTGNGDGPSLCALADRLLAEYEERTGLAWNSRTILGPGALVDLDTEIIRIRFPDWSLWSLPIVAHEFAHVVARVTPHFRDLQRNYPYTLTTDEAVAARLSAQLEELFADIFATYSCGPAFAAAMIALHFDPVTAHAGRRNHPTHRQRVDVICQTLAAMEAASEGGPGDASFAGVGQRLSQLWRESLDRAGTPPEPDEPPLLRPDEVGPKLFEAVAASYRLGATYERAAWERALELAGELRYGGFSLAAVRQRYPEARLHDILNVLWCARLVPQYSVHDLEEVALSLGNDYLKEVFHDQ